MKRNVISQLTHWKNSQFRKPLLVRGARQVGKTHLLKMFGEKEYKNCFHFDFEKERELASYFEKDLNPERILSELSIRVGKKIESKTDLVIFDEIQSCPKALSSLKYFHEDKPDQHICCAGSLLGVKLSTEPFPVGNVEFLDLYPLNFNEFILAHEDEMISDLFSDVCHAHKITEAGHQRLTELYHYFSFVGGMPRVVNTYLGSRKQDLFNMTQEVRKAQKDLVESYHKDFAKHAGKINSMHIVSVFENVPMQLARCLDGSVQRYRFRDVIPGKKSFVDLQGPIDWLEKAGLIIKVKICKRPEIPLESFCEQNLFKLYVLDSGVLGSMLNIPPEIFITGDYSMTKGFVAENFVATELLSSNNQSLHSWTGKNSEIEFIHLMKNEVIPVEVKAGNRTHAKSLGVYFKKYSPKFAVKLSARMPNAFRLGGVNQVPLYLAGQLGMLFNELV